MTESIQRIVLASRPVGEPTLDNFRSEKVPIPQPGSGQMLLRTLWLSLDPYMRGRMPHLMRAILTKRLTFRGFIVSDFSARYGNFMRDVSAWVREGRIKYREDVVEGLENAPRALIGLLRGENFGKLLVRVAR